MRVPGQPPRSSPDFARWLNGSLTRFCGKGYHQGGKGLVCRGTIRTLGIESPCLCKCHAPEEGTK